MIEYIGESRIDGYPIVKITNGGNEFFFEYFKNLDVKIDSIFKKEKSPALPGFFMNASKR